MKRVLITDDCHPILTEGLTRLGFACDDQPDITPEAVRQCIADYEGLIINSKILVDRDFLAAAHRLRFVARLGSGMEIVDRAAAAEQGVAILSSPEGNRNAVAEHALGMLLALANNIPRADREVRARIWRREANRGFELAGRTLGIIGFGNTGSQFARKLAGLDLKVLAFDKYLSGFAAGMPWVRECDLAEIQQNADIISLHLPLSAETKHLIDHMFLEKCRQGFILINTSRGACVKTADLVSALENGRVGGACLDVFENEKPLSFTDAESEWHQRLYALDKVVLSPHVAGWSHESKRRLAEVLLSKIATVLAKSAEKQG